MSLVERALKKLQENRTAPGVATSAPVDPRVLEQRSPVHTQPIEDESSSARSASLPNHVVEKSDRIVTIDMAALRSMDLAPPANIERLIANQYQQVKRGLVASALGRSGEAVPNGHLIMMASALSGEGKTFTSINLALSLAREKDTEVLLVDADVAKPHVSRIFGLQAERGLLDLLADSRLHPESLIVPTTVPGLKMLPAGKQRENATELLASDRMAIIAKQIGHPVGKKIVLFDSPPLLLSTESRAIVPKVGQVVLVVRADSTPQKAVLEALDAIGEGVPTSLILNQSETAPAAGYYGYGTYGDDGAASS